ncbi:hypothetical protein [Lichenifustis flavocetrariae]|uniref:Uncharacterized protein n=1 Tax=Lichenifustis flavocetrariae TaxID=2949735 RepID=A0AA41YZJ1_9HYPH|nr:hypothetical protein [Lichenifustis flavocetrariae]MCW6511444.1 hypothetical protein [Lichenifustis flavocetrariae]
MMAKRAPAGPDMSEVERQVRAAGLDRAWTQFRDDVLAAARQVAAQRDAATGVAAASEPWPPMIVTPVPTER